SVLRMMSRPLESGAYRKVRAASPGAAALIVAVSDFSGLTSSAWAFSRAAARGATGSLDRCTGRLPFQQGRVLINAGIPVHRSAKWLVWRNCQSRLADPDQSAPRSL